MSAPLLEVKNLTKHFPITGGLLGRQIGTVKAVNSASFKIQRGQTLGLVGESGCGKTTLGRSLLRLITPTAGDIFFDGQDITRLNKTQMRQMRRKMQIIFQDPYASLNPRMTLKSILAEPLQVHSLYTGREERRKRLLQLLDQVQLPADSLNRYPHEFSGGQRQRICIARALAVEPQFIVCDEPVSALDVSVQAQIINLLTDLQRELKLTYLFITHDLKVVEYIASEIAVMYLGHIVEMGTPQDLCQAPRHPYTKALFSAIPRPNPGHNSKRIILQGDVASPINPPPGCHFSPRCWATSEECKKNYPEVTQQSATHQYRCHHPLETP